MGRLLFRDFEYSDYITKIPDPLWRELRQGMRRKIQRERKKQNITGTLPAGGWDLIMDEDRHVVDPPRPRSVPDYITDEEFSSAADHIARAERMFEIYTANPMPDESLPSDIKHDVEAVVLGLAAWNDEYFDYAWSILDRLGREGEVDPFLAYETPVLTAFDVSDSLDDQPSPEDLVNRLVSHVDQNSPDGANGIRAAWGTYLMLHGRRKEGEKLLGKLIEESPDDLRFQVHLAAPLVELGDRRQAEEVLTKALELALEQEDPEMIEVLVGHLVEIDAMSPEEADNLMDDMIDAAIEEMEESEEDVRDDIALMEEAMQDHPEYAEFIMQHGPEAMMGEMNPMVHIAMHSMVEGMLRAGDIPEMQMALVKLTSQGMSRHDAIHELARPLLSSLHDMMSGKAQFDKRAYVRELKKLVK